MKALEKRAGNQSLESVALLPSVVLFFSSLVGICCKNSTWCNGIAYAKISHKPLQSYSEVHLVWEYFIHLSSVFNVFLPLYTQ